MQGFSITQGKGFHITFKNGYTVSVQFGPDNYCDNNNGKYEVGIDDYACGAAGCANAECAVTNPKGHRIDCPLFNTEDAVSNRSTPAEVLEIMLWASRQEAPF